MGTCWPSICCSCAPQAGRRAKWPRVLFCSRSSVYRIVRAYRAGTLTFEEATEQATQQRRLRLLTPSLKRSVQALLKTAPRAYGWCRTRWSCATLAVELQVRRGIRVSAETMRHWLHELGWEWKRAKVAAKDDDPATGGEIGAHSAGL